jgi:hypothetical protein
MGASRAVPRRGSRKNTRKRGGDSPGIAQVLGEPLTPGERVAVVGTASARTILLLQIRRGHRLRTKSGLFRHPFADARKGSANRYGEQEADCYLRGTEDSGTACPDAMTKDA